MELFSKYWGCHQIPERSYFFLGYQLPVCARCEGMIIGELIAVILIFTGFGIKWFYCLIMLLPNTGGDSLDDIEYILYDGNGIHYNVRTNAGEITT
ncbi:MAG: DUF2085 domain-containing protein, partial [Clostridium sp.]|nr:DUF2085 domain-containing protein [Clostridium sp.]